MKKSSNTADPGTASVDVAAILSELQRPLANADEMRAASLASLASARTARGYMMQGQRDALAAALGPSDPQVTALEASIKSNSAVATSLAMASSLAAHPLPPAADDETVVHGFVRDSASKPVAGVKVALAQPKGEVLATTSSAKDGHFVLRHKAATKAEVPERIELRVHDKRHPSPIELERGNGVAIALVHLED
jgi:hypothetical protein